MRKFLNVGLVALAAATLLTGCNCYNTMMKKAAKGITVSCAPEVVTLKGDNAVTTITVNVPAKAFHKDGVLKLTPVLVSALDGSEVAGQPSFYQGESVKDNYTVVPYSGGTVTIPVSIPYNPALRSSVLVLRGEAKCTKGGSANKFEFVPEFSKNAGTTTYEFVPDFERTNTKKSANAGYQAFEKEFVVARGVNCLQNMADNYAKVALVPDAYQRISTQQESANIMFVINQSKVRPAELTKAELNTLEQFIISNSGDAKKSVGSVVTQAYASPDGPIALNDRLSKERGASTKKAVGDKFQKNSVAAKSQFDVQALGEDWEGFQELVQKSDIQDKEMILQVLSMYSDPQVRDREIKNMSAAYKVLADKILPQLRRAKMSVDVKTEGLTDDELKAAVAKDLNSLKQEEALHAATLFQDNATKARIYKAVAEKYNCYRGWNNLGVALANSGDYAGAKQAFNKAASLNNTNPQVINNLGVVALAEGKKDEAAKYFAASTASEAKYNKGLVELAKGNYAEAAKSLDGYNQALADLLNGNVAKSKQQLANIDTWRANYTKAVIAAQEGNVEAMASNLNAAIKQNPEAAKLAATDVNFAPYFEHPDFIILVK